MDDLGRGEATPTVSNKYLSIYIFQSFFIFDTYCIVVNFVYLFLLVYQNHNNIVIFDFCLLYKIVIDVNQYISRYSDKI